MAKNSRKRLPTMAETSLWAKAMAAVQPVARPQGLMTENDGGDIGSIVFSHLKDSDTSHITFPDHSARRPQRILTGSPSATTKVQSQLPPIEVGQIGGTDRRTADRLKKGRLHIDARLDLHGYTEEQAHSHLLGFINAARASGARCVLIVTGKGRRDIGGTGKLKLAVPKWLNESGFRSSVLSVTYAQQRDGGDGALYVLLRKSNHLSPNVRQGEFR